jgi:hypothetical protein
VHAVGMDRWQDPGACDDIAGGGLRPQQGHRR